MNSKLPTGLQTLNFSRQCRSQILLNTVTMSAFKSIDALYNQIGWVTEVKVHIEENLLVKVNKLCSFTLHLAKFRQWWCGTLLAFIGTLVYFRFNYLKGVIHVDNMHWHRFDLFWDALFTIQQKYSFCS